jgi:hypothetical protein
MKEIIIETIGWIGAVLVVGAYLLNMQGKLKAEEPSYIWANLVGGFFFVINTFYHHAYPSMIVNIVWVLIALMAIYNKTLEK